jgi:hypothetical protein
MHGFSCGRIKTLVGTQNRHLMPGGSHAPSEGPYFNRGASPVQEWVVGLRDIQDPHTRAALNST